ncbi:MAG: aldo/keto reductase [Bacilli bacterium]|nr:aldo/keto reductase [Bacilli bacterium]
MEYRNFGKTNTKPSLLGFGCMRFKTMKNEEGIDVIDEKETEKMLDYAYEHGVTYYDTAYPYHGGKSEVVLGKCMKKYDRSTFLVADKLPMWKLEKTSDVRETFFEQLDRLQMNYVDFYLLHALNRDTFKKAKEINALQEVIKLKEEGYIRHIGFSFHDDLNTFKEIVDYYDNWEFCQIQYNYIDTDVQAGKAGIEYVKERNIPLVIMEPIKGGNLASYSSDVEKIFKDYNKDASIASWALRFVASEDNVGVILSGMSKMEQVVDNVEIFNNYKDLSDEERQVIEDAKKAIKARIKIACTGCRYCMPCPQGVKIPQNFSICNNSAMYNNNSYKWQYQNLKEEEKASNCIKRGKCEKMCPQHLEIRKSLSLLNEELK